MLIEVGVEPVQWESRFSRRYNRSVNLICWVISDLPALPPHIGIITECGFRMPPESMRNIVSPPLRNWVPQGQGRVQRYGEKMRPSPRDDVHNLVASPTQRKPAPLTQLVTQVVHCTHCLAHAIDRQRQMR